MGLMANINKIIESGNEHDLREALKEAKHWAKEGRIIELLDFLCPEDTKKSIVYPSDRKSRVIKR